MTSRKESADLSPGQPTRLSRSRRANNPPSMRLMPRDLEILSAVAEYRILRQDQIQTLFFGSKSTAQYRLSHLYQHGFLSRHFLPVQGGWSPTLYTLDTRGREVLRVEYGDAAPTDKASIRDLKQEFLEHTLALNDVRIAFSLACRAPGLTLTTWLDEATLKVNYDRVAIRYPNGKRATVSLIPDSYCVIQTPQGTARFFIELDRGTMTTQRFAAKVLAYFAFVESGHYQQRYQSRSLRVLTITLSQKRLMNLKQVTEAVHGTQLFWFGKLSEIKAQDVFRSSLWRIAGREGVHLLIAPAPSLTL